MDGFVESSNACPIIENVNVTAADTVIITNADEFRNSTEFSVKDSNWEVIPLSIFSTFPYLHRIELSVNIKRLTAETFSNADHLHTMQLSGNKIEVIPSNAFIGAPIVQIIDLSANKIKNIEDGAFNGLSRLSHLHFTRNELQSIRNGTFGGALNLKQIVLDRNQIETIEPHAFRLPHLVYIDLGHNQLKTLTADVFNGALQLKTVILNDNELWQIGELFVNLSLKKLNTLVLANNPVDSINLGHALNLPKLENLNVRNTTPIVHVDWLNATRMESDALLKAIDLSSNNLTRSDILSVLEIFPHLADLNLELNLFTKIDGLNRIQETFKELRTLMIGCNRFECPWLTNELKMINVTLDVLSCPEPTIVGAKNVRNVNCV